MGAKNILFISYDGMTDPLGQSQVIPYLSGLTKYGYTFTILSCDKPDSFKQNKEYVEKLIAPFPIKWVSIPYHKNPPLLSSIYDFFRLRQTAQKLHLKEHFDLIHTRVGLPPLVALWMKKKYNIPFLNDIRAFWAKQRADGGMWNIKNPVFNFVYHFFKKKEIEVINKAAYNTCLTFAAEKEIHSWDKILNQPIPIQVIPCSADLDLFNPENRDELLAQQFRKELGIGESDFIISYLGSIGGWYLTDEMMRFCKLLSDAIPAAKFLFIAPHHHEQIVAAAVKQGLPAEKLIVKNARRHEVPVLISFSNFSLFFIKHCYSKISSSPTKHAEIMAMGIPVITNSGVGDVKEIVNRYNAGYVTDDFTDKSFQDIIGKIKEGNSFNKTAIRNGAAEFYSLQNAVEKYRRVYSTVFDGAPAG